MTNLTSDWEKDELIQQDPDTFYASFDEMIRYVNDQSHWAQVLEELESRTVKCFTFYDMVLDFMILDGFDFLDNLPVAVASTLQNRFLPNRIKEATLTSLVLTGLFAKKAILKDMILGFVRDMFSFTRARYTSVEALAEDIVTLAKQRIEKAAEDLSSISSTS